MKNQSKEIVNEKQLLVIFKALLAVFAIQAVSQSLGSCASSKSDAYQRAREKVESRRNYAPMNTAPAPAKAKDPPKLIEPVFVVLEERDIHSAVPRWAVNIEIPRGLSEKQVESALKQAAREAKKRHPEAGGVAIAAQGTDGSSGDAGNADYSPYGDWSKVDPAIPESSWDFRIDLNHAYFEKIMPSKFKVGQAVKLRSVIKGQSFDAWLWAKSDATEGDKAHFTVPPGTSAKIIGEDSGNNYVGAWHQFNVKLNDGRTGWVYVEDVTSK